MCSACGLSSIQRLQEVLQVRRTGVLSGSLLLQPGGGVQHGLEGGGLPLATVAVGERQGEL